MRIYTDNCIPNPGSTLKKCIQRSIMPSVIKKIEVTIIYFQIFLSCPLFYLLNTNNLKAPCCVYGDNYSNIST